MELNQKMDQQDFDGVKKSGIWVGKFEVTGNLLTGEQACTNEECDTSKVTIKLGKASIRNQTISSFFIVKKYAISKCKYLWIQ